MKRPFYAATVLGLLASGCAAALPLGPTTELVDARRSLGSARERVSPGAVSELDAAEAELLVAEVAEQRSPHSLEARDRAYLAMRAADRSRIASVAARHAEEIEEGKVRVTTLRERLERASQRAQDRANQGHAALRAREERTRTFYSDLSKAMGVVGEIVWNETTIGLRLPVEAVFIPHSTLITIPAKRRLRRISEALRGGPPLHVQVMVVDDEHGVGRDKDQLARQRADRIRTALLEFGTPYEYMGEATFRNARGEGVVLVLTSAPIVISP